MRNSFPPIEINRHLMEVYDCGLLRECILSENPAERRDMVERTSMIIVRGSQALRGRM